MRAGERMNDGDKGGKVKTTGGGHVMGPIYESDDYKNQKICQSKALLKKRSIGQKFKSNLEYLERTRQNLAPLWGKSGWDS